MQGSAAETLLYVLLLDIARANEIAIHSELGYVQ